MKWRHVVLVLIGLAVVIWCAQYVPFPRLGDDAVLDMIAFHDLPRWRPWLPSSDATTVQWLLTPLRLEGQECVIPYW